MPFPINGSGTKPAFLHKAYGMLIHCFVIRFPSIAIEPRASGESRISPKASFLNRRAVAAQANDVEDVFANIDYIDSRGSRQITMRHATSLH